MNIYKCKPLALWFCLLALSPNAMALTEQQQAMLDQIQQMDEVDHLEFEAQDSKANACIQARDFDCAEQRIAKAAKFINNREDRKVLALTRESLAMERKAVDDEIYFKRSQAEAIARQKAERERDERLAEARAEREEGERRLKLAAMSAGAMLGGAGQLSPERQAQLFSAIARDSEQGGSGNVQAMVDQRNDQLRAFTERQQKLTAERDALRQQQAAARAAAVVERPAAAVKVASTEPAAPARKDVQIVQYKQQTVALPTWRESCPQGYSPARNPNGTTVTANGGTAYCLKDKTEGGTAQAGQGTGASTGAGVAGASGGSSGAGGTGSSEVASNETSNPTKPAKPAPTKRSKWGEVRAEAIVVCRETTKKNWECNGPLDNQSWPSDTLEEALNRQSCPDATLSVGGPVLKGQQWQAYQCGRSLGVGESDVAKRYKLVTPRRSFICPAYDGGGRCATLYTGQDKV
jgi:hypothetical protein